MDSFIATWRRISSENEDEFHKALGIPQAALDVFLKSADMMRFSISQDGDTFTNTVDCPGMPTHTEKYKLGVPLKAKDMLGSDSDVIIKCEGGKIVDTRSSPGKYEIIAISTANGNKMTVVRTTGSVKTTAVWEKC